MPEEPAEPWLTIDEAARRAGVSRIRMRQAISAGLIEARRDNRGFWRVASGAPLAGLEGRIDAARVAPQALIELLFDEIEESDLRLADREAALARMSAIAARQQEAIERALALAETPASADAKAGADRIAAANERSARLIEAALAKLSARDAEVFKLTGLLDRAFAAISTLEDEVKRQSGVAERQRGLLDRLFALAQLSLELFSNPEARSGGFRSRLRERLGGARGVGSRT